MGILQKTFYSLFFFVTPLIAVEKSTICLNMIVKDEREVIGRCLRSVKPLINYWVIVDTGSTDGTQEIIKEVLEGVPGELHESCWVNFSHNRNEALDFAKGKGDYLLFIDADEQLDYPIDLTLGKLDKDRYCMRCLNGATSYFRVQLVNSQLPWRWKGVLHEVIIAPNIRTEGVIEGITNLIFWDSHRNQDPEKYFKDAQTLERALKEEPNNTRNLFYLGQSYKDAGMLEEALQAYKRRGELTGCPHERFHTYIQIGLLEEELGGETEEILKAYYSAAQLMPKRVEPLYHLSRIYLSLGKPQSAYGLLKHALTFELPTDYLWLDRGLYEFGLLSEFLRCSLALNKGEEATHAAQKLLERPLPQEMRDWVEDLFFPNNHLRGIE